MSGTTWIFDRTRAQGRLELIDRDRLDLVHRMSTNNLNTLKPGQGASTVLTTALARIIDRVIIYHRGDTALMITNRPDTVRTWLQKHIFFQDKIKIRDVSAGYAQFEIQGSEADVHAEVIAPGVSSLPLHHFIQVEELMLVAKTYGLSGDNGYTVIAKKDRALPEWNLLTGDDAQYEQLRIAAGMPGSDHELTEDFIPLEANLWDSVSFNKGCYIGQEIIARMESRNRLAKTLVGLRAEGQLQVGTSLLDGDRTIGTITSVTQLDNGLYAALGFVKPEYAEPRTTLYSGDSNGTAVQISAVPLIQSRK